MPDLPSVTGLTYALPGRTRPSEIAWAGDSRTETVDGFRLLTTRVCIGAGEACWTRASTDVLRWAVKTRSGFAVDPPEPVELGRRYRIRARIGPFGVTEPVEVVAVVTSPDRVGFAYGTLTGHPVSGEEAFVVDRDADGRVWLTLRSLTRRAAGTGWGLAFPVLLLAQRFYRRRYARSLS